MDILARLRLLFWSLVLVIWGLFMYQYMNEDISALPQMRFSKNPFSKPAAPYKIARHTSRPGVYVPPAAPAMNTVGRSTRTAAGTHSLVVGNLPAAPDLIPGHAQEEKVSIHQAIEDAEKASYPPLPDGFAAAETRHFLVYEEGASVSEELTAQLENLHGNIMLDLVAFSPWTREKKVFIYYCHNQQTYQRLTGRPAWSGGAASLSERKIYLYHSSEAFGILAHELTHIYFDSFFTAENPSPLWLSEGVATFIQSERGLSTPLWLTQNLRILSGGGGFKLEDLVRIDDMADAEEDSVRLWYAQSYSVTRFLMRAKTGDAFYMFCRNLRDGHPVAQAMYRAYGMPYNRMSSLEYAWRYDLKTGKISGIQ